VIQTWWREHGLNRSVQKLRRGIMPAAWNEVADWVAAWRSAQDAAIAAWKASKTSERILAYLQTAGTPQTPASIAAALPIPRERAKKAMQRMAVEGKLVRLNSGYTVRSLGTF
jgi:hypothetical protein